MSQESALNRRLVRNTIANCRAVLFFLRADDPREVVKSRWLHRGQAVGHYIVVGQSRAPHSIRLRRICGAFSCQYVGECDHLRDRDVQGFGNLVT